MAEAPLLIVRDTRLHDRPVDIRIEGNRIAAITERGPGPGPEIPPGARIVEGRGTAALPGLMNAHTHSAMAYLRGFADDMPLMPWLREKIWPFEAGLTEEDVYWGARLACLEMIRTGTTFFNDMYWHFHGTARAALDAGMRAQVAGVFIDMGDPERARRQMEESLAQAEAAGRYGDRVRFTLGPHAIYTVSEAALAWVAEQASEHGWFVCMHLSETIGEVQDCLTSRGLRPGQYLDRLGLLGPRFLAVHAVHLDETEIALLAERGCHAVHNPVSNLKLASGGPMPYAAMRAAGLSVLIGTDSVASNNNLDLFEELKFAALLAKHASGDPTVLPAHEALDLATRAPAAAFGIPAGELAPGRLADLILIDLANPYLFPGHDLVSDLVYAAHGRAVHTTICDGRVLMSAGQIADEDEIRAEATARLARLAG